MYALFIVLRGHVINPRKGEAVLCIGHSVFLVHYT